MAVKGLIKPFSYPSVCVYNIQSAFLKGRQTDRQTGRQTDRQTGRQADRQTDRQTDSTERRCRRGLF